MPPNTGVAPICNALAEQPTFATIPPPLPRLTPPSVGNPPSIIAAILQLQQAMTALTNQPPHNNTTPSLPAGGGGVGPSATLGSGGQKTTQQNADWEETDRQTQNVKVVNPDDDSQFVIVKEITRLEFTHSTTGETIVFLRDPP